MPEVKLSWESAEVKDATLSVQLDGDLSEEWQANFQTTAKLLGGQWGKVEIEDDSVKVGDLGAGDEEKVKHYLESVVTQANASAESDDSDDEESEEEDSDDEAKSKEDEEEGKGSGDEGESEHKDPDSEMTERFRSFGSKSEERESGSESSQSESGPDD